jgi:glycine/D-amino acid oxidase-like deaminating enzyme
MEVDYIIVGQGIAGTALSYALIQRGKKVLVIDRGAEASSSKAAAGIFNPVTGKRLSKTWEADNLFPFLQDFYTHMESDIKANFLHLLPVYRPFISIEEQNAFISKTASPEFAHYTDVPENYTIYSPYIHNPYGGILIKQSGYVDVPNMLEAYRQFLINSYSYCQDSFTYADIQYTATHVVWKGFAAKKILFCEGTFNKENPYFNWLPFVQVKGELLLVHIPGTEIQHIINRGIFILPLGKEMFKVGATYTWDDLSWKPTQEARAELTGKLKELLKIPFTVTDHLAGIRPASADRRPFVGFHPENPALGIFNGLGTKGISLAPYFAHQFVEHLEEDKDLHREVHINRYFSLYYRSKN